MSKADDAMAFKKQGFSCSQSVLAAFAEELGMDLPSALRISTGFAGGMAGTGGTCGAVTGATMAIGLKHGSKAADETDAKAHTAKLTRELMSRITGAHGSLVCKELLGCEIDTPEKFKAARESGVLAETCPAVIRLACDTLEEIL